MPNLTISLQLFLHARVIRGVKETCCSYNSSKTIGFPAG